MSSFNFGIEKVGNVSTPLSQMGSELSECLPCKFESLGHLAGFFSANTNRPTRSMKISKWFY